MDDLWAAIDQIRRVENIEELSRRAESLVDSEVQDWIEDRMESMVKEGHTPEQALRSIMGYDDESLSNELPDDYALAADADTLEGDAPTGYMSRPGGVPAEDGEHLDE